MHILYLEDFEPDTKFIRQYMDSTPHKFDIVSSIDDAVQYLQHQLPDVLLLDIVIRGEMAYDLILYASNQASVKHIVAVTAKALPDDVQRYLELGCARVIAKPFTIDELEKVLNQLS